MANITRMAKSYRGAIRGIYGSTIPPVRYHVQITSADIASGLTDPTYHLQQLVPIGTSYPFPSFAASVTGYGVENEMGLRDWECFTTFRPLADSLQGWRFGLRGFLDARKIFETIETNPAARRLIGPNVYNQAPVELQTPRYTAQGWIEGSPMRLVQTEMRRAIGHDVPRPGFSVYFFNDSVSGTGILTKCGLAGAFLGRVNSGGFAVEHGGHVFNVPGTVLFSEISVDQQFGSQPNIPNQTGVNHAVQLRFDFNPEGFSPIEIIHDFIDSEGNHSFIIDLFGNPPGIVREKFDVLKSANLNDVFNLF